MQQELFKKHSTHLNFSAIWPVSLMEIRGANFLTRSLKSAAAHAIYLIPPYAPNSLANGPCQKFVRICLLPGSSDSLFGGGRRRMGSKGGRHILLFFWAEILPPWPKWLSRSRRVGEARRLKCLWVFSPPQKEINQNQKLFMKIFPRLNFESQWLVKSSPLSFSSQECDAQSIDWSTVRSPRKESRQRCGAGTTNYPIGGTLKLENPFGIFKWNAFRRYVAHISTIDLITYAEYRVSELINARRMYIIMYRLWRK